jgi:hypothetical protein
VCESCKRKAAGLTLFRPGDLRDELLVGKKICNTCVARAFRSPEPDAFEIRWLLITEIAIFILVATSLVITSLLRIDSTIPAVLLLLSLTLFVSERYARRKLWKPHNSNSARRSEELVSVEKLFDS